MFYSFVIISHFCLVLVPFQLIYVVIEIKEINLTNPDLFVKLGGYSHSHKSKLVKDFNCKFSA